MFSTKINSKRKAAIQTATITRKTPKDRSPN